MSKLTRKEAQEYTDGLGMAATGAYRLMDLAINQLQVPEALGLSPERWVQEKLGGYSRWTVEDRQRVVAELTEAGRTALEIAAVLGIDETTVKRDRSVLKARTRPRARALPAAPVEEEGRTPREEAEELFAEGWTNAEVAAELGKSPDTVNRWRKEMPPKRTKAQEKEAEAFAETVIAPMKDAAKALQRFGIAMSLDEFADEYVDDAIRAVRKHGPDLSRGEIEEIQAVVSKLDMKIHKLQAEVDRLVLNAMEGR